MEAHACHQRSYSRTYLVDSLAFRRNGKYYVTSLTFYSAIIFVLCGLPRAKLLSITAGVALFRSEGVRIDGTKLRLLLVVVVVGGIIRGKVASGMGF